MARRMMLLRLMAAGVVAVSGVETALGAVLLALKGHLRLGMIRVKGIGC